MNSDFYRLFTHFWWLVFPLFGMAMGMAQLWSRHARANRGLDILKSYIDQGKEPPPELLQYLKGPMETRRDTGAGTSFFVAILFAGLATAFAFISFLERENHIYFIVIIMAALALGMTVKGLFQRSAENRRDLP